MFGSKPRKHVSPDSCQKPRDARAMMESLEDRLLMSTYYIATNGSDVAAGNAAAPFATLRHALETAKPGDTVLMRGGTYSGSGWQKLAPKVSGTAKAPITIAAAPKQKVVIDGKKALSFMKLDAGQQYLNFRGFTVKNFMVDFNLQGGKANAHHITLDSLELASAGVLGRNTEGRGVRMADGVHDIKITNTKIHDIGGVGIAGIGKVSNVTIDKVTIDRVNDGRGAGGDGDGINFTYRTSTRGYAQNITVTNSKISNASEDGIDIKGDNIVLMGNTVTRVTADAYKAWSPYGVGRQGRFIVRNNIGTRAGQVVFEAFGLPALTMSGNTFVGSGEEATVMYKRGTGQEKWKGSLDIRSTVMEARGAHQALIANKYNMARFILAGNTYYSAGLPKNTVTIFTAATGSTSFSNTAMSDRTFTQAIGTERAGRSTRPNVSALLSRAGAA